MIAGTPQQNDRSRGWRKPF